MTAVTERPDPGTSTLGDVVAADSTLARIRAEVAKRTAEGLPNDVVIPDAREEIIALRADRWRESWLEHCPIRYHDATLAALSPEQDKAEAVSKWLDSGHLHLALRGPVGTGKSYALAAIGHAALARGIRPRMWSMADLIADLRPGGDDRLFDKAATCDVLLLDDIGVEKDTDWTGEVMGRLIDARSRNKRRTAWSTNLPYPTMVERYGSRLVDRMIDDAVLVTIEGPSRRAPATW
jgi:DNA replication protein DnaC